ncbi:MAG: hypothetical protein IKO49_08110, partial [Bacilli bacterium]|nr:hypothetical protein [Bacilli bacterium]
LVLMISVGYAAITTTLKINGTSKVKKAGWSIYWDNVQIKSGSVTGENVTTAPTTTGTTTTEVTYAVTLPEPGDFYEFTVDAVNAGTIDAMIAENGVSNIAYTDSTYETVATLPKVLKYTITYADGSAIGDYHLLAKKSGSTPTTEKYKVRVEYRNDSEINISDLADIDADTTYYFKFSVNYVQTDSNAVQRAKIVCKKAETLHTETCSRPSRGCIDNGYAQGDIITYGHTDSTKLENGTLKNGLSQGYALDCDIDGTEIYERFYYVSDYYNTNLATPSFDDKYATLIYYKNIGTTAVAYNSLGYNYQGPTELLSSLPTTGTSGTWKNFSLVNEERQILNETGGNTTSGGALPKFAYTGKAARLLTTQEIDAATGSTSRTSTGYLNNVDFLLEDTSYSKSSGCSGGACHYWLETPVASSDSSAWLMTSDVRFLTSFFNSISFGVRPAVEVPKSNISLE